MKVLTSAVSVDEARLLVDLGTDIIDVKNPAEGSLGAQPPWVTRAIVDAVRSRGVAVSAALGDFPAKPGTAALAAYGVAQLGVSFVKVGLYGPMTDSEAFSMLAAANRAVEMASSKAQVVAAGYADYRSFGGIGPEQVIRASTEAGCPIVMLDTSAKNGTTLWNCLGRRELDTFIQSARKAGLGVALAGSIRSADIPTLRKLCVDIVGVRGAICARSERTNSIDAQAARQFMDAVRGQSATAQPSRDSSIFKASEIAAPSDWRYDSSRP